MRAALLMLGLTACDDTWHAPPHMHAVNPCAIRWEADTAPAIGDRVVIDGRAKVYTGGGLWIATPLPSDADSCCGPTDTCEVCR